MSCNAKPRRTFKYLGVDDLVQATAEQQALARCTAGSAEVAAVVVALECAWAELLCVAAHGAGVALAALVAVPANACDQSQMLHRFKVI